MKEIIYNSKEKLDSAKSLIKDELREYFSSFNYKTPSSSFQVIDLKCIEDLSKIYSSQGFYILMTNKHFEDNYCKLSIDGCTAIYRGHCCTTKDRIMSHLFNVEHNRTISKHKTKYKVCLKIEDKVNGINIDQKPYSDYIWKVIVHKMKGSTLIIREQAEKAFDEKYGIPVKSHK